MLSPARLRHIFLHAACLPFLACYACQGMLSSFKHSYYLKHQEKLGRRCEEAIHNAFCIWTNRNFLVSNRSMNAGCILARLLFHSAWLSRALYISDICTLVAGGLEPEPEGTNGCNLIWNAMWNYGPQPPSLFASTKAISHDIQLVRI